jgi:hypothetical protein
MRRGHALPLELAVGVEVERQEKSPAVSGGIMTCADRSLRSSRASRTHSFRQIPAAVVQ